MVHNNAKDSENHGQLSTSGVLPDVVGQSDHNQVSNDGEETEASTLKIRHTSDASLHSDYDGVDYNKSIPGTPTKLTEL